MDIGRYQSEARKTRVYPSESNVIYPALKMAGEAGEVAQAVGKYLRGDYPQLPEEPIWHSQEFREVMRRELGDVLWYIAALCDDLSLDMNDVAKTNIKKLRWRKATGTIRGTGDNR